MSKFKLPSILLFTSILFCSISSCGNNNNANCNNGVKDSDESGVDCGGYCNACVAKDFRIKTYTFQSNAYSYTENYNYDNNGRIVSMNNTNGYIETYSYGNDTIQVSRNDNQLLTYILNSQGFAVKLHTKYLPAGNYSTSIFKLDLDGHVITYVGNPGDINVWSGGNLVSRTDSNGVLLSTTTYFTNKSNTIGNVNFGKYFLGKSSVNLQNSNVLSNGGTTVFTYEFDALNRVTKYSTSNTGIVSYTYY